MNGKNGKVDIFKDLLKIYYRVLSDFRSATVVRKLESPIVPVEEAEFPKLTFRNSYRFRLSYLDSNIS